MNIPHNVEAHFERINKHTTTDQPGKVHMTLNGTPICGTWSRQKFQEHKSGVSRVSINEFMKDPCGQQKNGKLGTQGCLPLLQG